MCFCRCFRICFLLFVVPLLSTHASCHLFSLLLPLPSPLSVPFLLHSVSFSLSLAYFLLILKAEKDTNTHEQLNTNVHYILGILNQPLLTLPCQKKMPPIILLSFGRALDFLCPCCHSLSTQTSNSTHTDKQQHAHRQATTHAHKLQQATQQCKQICNSNKYACMNMDVWLFAQPPIPHLCKGSRSLISSFLCSLHLILFAPYLPFSFFFERDPSRFSTARKTNVREIWPLHRKQNK
ncbi:MAG: hypothetical protein JOS17DRAFT_5168 [Linnemannia elongata]|nr:MAG: hypothetical protein JOS17DRAFT_5168 [Linnemannia elongata]